VTGNWLDSLIQAFSNIFAWPDSSRIAESPDHEEPGRTHRPCHGARLSLAAARKTPGVLTRNVTAGYTGTGRSPRSADFADNADSRVRQQNAGLWGTSHQINRVSTGEEEYFASAEAHSTNPHEKMLF